MHCAFNILADKIRKLQSESSYFYTYSKHLTKLVDLCLAYLQSRRSRGTRLSMWARGTLKTQTHIIKEDTE